MHLGNIQSIYLALMFQKDCCVAEILLEWAAETQTSLKQSQLSPHWLV